MFSIFTIKCLWWHRQYHHWWIGPCDKIGKNEGYAYIDEDVSCPQGGIWRRGGSDEFINDVKNLDLCPPDFEVCMSPVSPIFHIVSTV